MPPPPTVVAPSQALDRAYVKLALDVGGARRAGSVLTGLAAWLTARAFAGFFIAAGIRPGLVGVHPTLDGRFIAVGLGLATLWFGRRGLGEIRQAMTSGARLIVEEDGLYGGLAGYRVIAVLDLDERAPNVAILFDHAIDFPAVRRRGMFFTREPRPGAREPGVAVRVKDPEAAREAFADWGVVRDLTLDDVAYARRLRRRP